MPEASAAAKIGVGQSRAAGSVEVKVTAVLIGVAVVLAAFAVSWAAEGATPRKLYWQKPLTELESAAQDFHAHLATVAELGQPPVSVPVAYPERTAPGVTSTMHQGFASGSYRPVAPLAPVATVAW